MIGANDAISWSEAFNAKWSDIYRGGNLSWEAVTEEQKPLVDTAEADWVKPEQIYLFEPQTFSDWPGDTEARGASTSRLAWRGTVFPGMGSSQASPAFCLSSKIPGLLSRGEPSKVLLSHKYLSCHSHVQQSVRSFRHAREGVVQRSLFEKLPGLH